MSSTNLESSFVLDLRKENNLPKYFVNLSSEDFQLSEIRLLQKLIIKDNDTKPQGINYYFYLGHVQNNYQYMLKKKLDSKLI